jgi:uncharacterized protein (DUF885 family)
VSGFDAARRRLIGGGLLALSGCASTPPAAESPHVEAFGPWSERFAEDWLRLTPEFSSFSRYFDGDEQRRLDGLVSPPAGELRPRRLALAREGLARVAAFERGALAPDERVAAATLRFALERSVANAPFEDHAFAFNQFWGLQTGYQNLLGEVQPLRQPADVAPLLQRLGAYPGRIDAELERTRAAAARGLLPPRFIVERARAQLRMLIEVPLAQEPVVASALRRMGRIDALPAPERDAAAAAVRERVEHGIRPAWARVAAWMDETLPRLSDDAGLWRLPDGEAAYAQALSAATTSTLSPAQVHAMGLEQVASIEAEMDRLLVRLGERSGTVGERMAALQTRVQPAAEPDPRPALIERYTAYVRDAERRATALFDLRPQAAVEVRRVGPLTERSAAASYSTPAPDGSRPGVFWVPLPGPRFNVLGMRSLAVHEAVPGHHFQLAILQEQTGLLRWQRLRVFGGGSAHSEGWALYAERLAIEQGWYDERIDGPGPDLHGLLGAWGAQLFRARRLVVDTGLHAKRWTRQQAIDYGISASEVERYVAIPGQACAYMTGLLRIRAAREAARQRLGPRFELKTFHNLVLATGSVPLDVLDEVVRGWQPASA